MFRLISVVSIYIVFIAFLTGCASAPRVVYPIINGAQEKAALPNNTPVVIADICPKSEAKLPAAGIFNGTKNSNMQLTWKWICADLPVAILSSNMGRVSLSKEKIPFDDYAKMIDSGTVDPATIAKINTSQVVPSRYIIFLKLDGSAFTEAYSNSASYTVSTLVYDNETKNIKFSYVNPGWTNGTAWADSRTIYAGLVDKALQIALGDVRLPPSASASAQQK